MSEKLSSIIPKVQEVIVGETVVTIARLPLGKYAKVLLILKGLPGGVLKDLQALEGANDEALIATLFGVMAEAWEQVIEIISLGSGLDKDQIANDPEIGLDGGVALLMAIWEVNNLASAFTSVKNALSRNKTTKK